MDTTIANPYRWQSHGEHWCGSVILYNREQDIHICGGGMHDDNDLVVDDCNECEEEGYYDD